MKEKKVLSLEDKQFRKNKWFFSAGGIGRDMLYTLVSTYFLQYVQFGLTLTVAQFATLSILIGILGRIWDGINDPMMGAIIDGTHLKMGKFRPWIMIGAILTALLTVLLFNVRPTGWSYIFVICAIYLVWEASFTMNDIGYWSMIPSLSRTKERRDNITTYVTFFAGLGTIIMTGLVTFFSPGNVLTAYAVYSVVACVAILVCQMMVVFTVKEAPRDEVEAHEENSVSFKKMVKTIFHNKQLLWMSLALLFSSTATAILLGLIYNLYYLEGSYNGDIFIFLVIYGVANTVIQLMYPRIAKKFSRKQIQFVCFFIQAAGYIGLGLMGWFNTGIPLIIPLCVFALLVFAGNTLFYVAELVNLNNCVEYNEYITGRREEAVVTTMRPLIVKFADAVKYLVVTITLIVSGLYAITQNISTIETQKNVFEKRYETAQTAREYVSEYKALKLLEDNGATVEELNEEMANGHYEVLNKCQVNPEYLDAIGYMYLVRVDDKGKYLDSVQLKDATSSVFVVDGYDYQLLITVSDASNTEIHNAADEIYDAKRTFGTRLVIRISCCVVPCALMFGSMWVQRKKFIVDEEYYDQMMAEIESKKEHHEEDTSLEAAE